jgi:hypothetical protein
MKIPCTFIALLVCSAAASAGNEVMTDRCSHEVSIVDWGNAPGSNDAVLLKRHNGKTPWTPPFTVKLGDDGHIRWWCHSTTGNAFDPGTWRIKDVYAGYGCKLYADNSTEDCGPNASFGIGSSEWKGWTAERSRCGNRSNRIRARLDGNRKLLIQCLPK